MNKCQVSGSDHSFRVLNVLVGMLVASEETVDEYVHAHTSIHKSGWGPWRKRKVETTTHIELKKHEKSDFLGKVCLVLRCQNCDHEELTLVEDFDSQFERNAAPALAMMTNSKIPVPLSKAFATTFLSTRPVFGHQVAIATPERYSTQICERGFHDAHVIENSTSMCTISDVSVGSTNSESFKTISTKFIVCKKCGLTNCLLLYPSMTLQKIMGESNTMKKLMNLVQIAGKAYSNNLMLK